MRKVLLIISLVLVYALSIHARNFVSGGICYKVTSGISPFSVCVTNGGTYKGNMIIPSTVVYNDTIFSVKSIDNYAFNGCVELTSITIPNSVTYIGTGAFYGCTGITSVFIPSSVTQINSQAFYNCSGLSTLTIGDYAVNQSIVYILSSAFSGCTSLTTLNINVPISSYYPVFQNLNSIQSLKIGNSVTSINSALFSSLAGLRKVTIGDAGNIPSNISVALNAFNGSNNLDSLILNSNIQITGYPLGSVSPFSNLSGIIIGKNVTSIGDYAFNGCTKLKTIEIPDAVTSIGNNVFSGCNNITDITLGGSLSKLGTSVFTGCSSLQNINVVERNSTYTSIDGVLFSKNKLTLVQYAIGRTGSYDIPHQTNTVAPSAFASSTGLAAVTIPQSIKTIQALAFSGCNGMSAVTIGHKDSISTSSVMISSDAFSGCSAIKTLILNKTLSYSNGNNSPFKSNTSLNSIFVGDGVVSIPDYAFYGCSGISSVRLGENNDNTKTPISVAAYAFSGCGKFSTLELNRSLNVNSYQTSPFSSITELLIGKGAITIGDNSFNNCASLANIIYSNQSLIIGKYAFGYCPKLQSFDFSTVTSMGQGAFYGCTSLTKASIPLSIKMIPSYAFYGCTSLSSISLNDSIFQIGNYAFNGCSQLSSLTLPQYIKSINDYAFGSCSTLTSITLNPSLVSIGSYTFADCPSFTNINFPASLRTIGDNAFQNCKGLTSLYVPKTITSLGSGTFTGCSGITSITIGDADDPGLSLTMGYLPFSGCDGVTSLTLNKNVMYGQSPFSLLSSLVDVTISNHVTRLNDFAFYRCQKIVSLTIPNSVKSIGFGAFRECTSLTSIKLPDTITSLGNSFFYGCTSLQSIDIPSTVTTLGNFAFYQCSALKTIKLPKSIVTIGGLALSECTGLTTLIAGAPSPAVLGRQSFGAISSQCKLYVPVGSKISYQKASQWKDFANIFETEIIDSIPVISPSDDLDPVTGLSKTVNIKSGGLLNALTQNDLANINKLTIVGTINASDFLVLRDSLKVLNILDLTNASIESYTGTMGTGGNTSITYPANTIPLDAFFNPSNSSGKNSLISVKLPNTITAIGDNAFKLCGGLMSLPLPESVTYIGASAYYNCSNATGVLDIPSSVSYIGHNAFNRCHGLTDIRIPYGIKSIEIAAFAECDNLTRVTLPLSVTELKPSAFYNCRNLIDISIPTSVTNIANYVFTYCGITFCNLPSGITEINDYTFTECYALQTIIIPATVASIGYGAFVRCFSLENIYVYATTPPAAESYSFDYVDKLKCVLYVPIGTLKLYQEANGWKDFVNIKEMGTTGLNNLKTQQLTVSPNPVIDKLTINGLDDTGILTLTSSNGQTILTQQVENKTYISLSGVSAGVYIAIIKTKNFLYELKLIKKE